MAMVPRGVVESGGRSGSDGDDFTVIRCIDWLRAKGEAYNRELWDRVDRIAQTARRPSVQLRANQMLLDRIDPIPRAPAVEIDVGPVVIGWNLDASPSPTRPGPSSSSSTPALPANGLAPPSSSATDALANL